MYDYILSIIMFSDVNTACVLMYISAPRCKRMGLPSRGIKAQISVRSLGVHGNMMFRNDLRTEQREIGFRIGRLTIMRASRSTDIVGMIEALRSTFAYYYHHQCDVSISLILLSPLSRTGLCQKLRPHE
jgi:hypothetical protein